MPDLLLELFSEEIPARMQRQAAEDLKRLVTNALVERGLLYEGAQAFATPRRLALHVVGLLGEQPNTREERKGPRVGAPEAAISGFLKSAGLARIEDAGIEKDPKKGEFYVAIIEKRGRPTKEVLSEIIPDIIRTFPWPKSMHWGDYKPVVGGSGGYGGPIGYGIAGAYGSVGQHTLRWVRPLRSIVCLFSTPQETPEIVKFSVDDLTSGDVTYGHRFMAPAAIRVKRFDDYVKALKEAKVVLDADERKQIILHTAREHAFVQGLELVEDEALLEEVAGLVEWPVALVGEFEAAFLEIPPEVIRATIRANQKCFVLRDGAPAAVMAGLDPAIHVAVSGPSVEGGAPPKGVDGRDKPGHDGNGAGAPGAKLANKFILVSNLIASDGGVAIAAGNARVVRARLSDARHFWKTDLAPLPDYRNADPRPLDQRLAKLRALNIVFHAKLGTQGERVERIAALAKELAPKVGADPALAERAARLAKADLVTEMVGEFPELQGLMGRYYASAQKESPDVAAAIEEHYKPQGPGDRIPTAPVSIAVALADKLDALVGFWAIDEKPTGSKDPYALRRAALGMIRVVLENGLRISVLGAIRWALLCHILRGFRPASGYVSLARPYAMELEQPPGVDWSVPPYVNLLDYDNLISRIAGDAQYFQGGNPGHGAGVDETEVARFNLAYNEVRDRLERLDHLCSRVAAYEDFFSVQLEADSTQTESKHANTTAIAYCEADDRLKIIYGRPSEKLGANLLAFFADRLKVYLREKGARHDLIDAVFALPDQDDLTLIVRRVEALGSFLETDDGANLLTGYRRAANILRAEEKKDGAGAFEGPYNPMLASQTQERALAEILDIAGRNAFDCAKNEDFNGAMRALATLRVPVDEFFDKVTVNADDTTEPGRRRNRLRLLNQMRSWMHTVADFSKIAG